jgi:hypothetical protein
VGRLGEELMWHLRMRLAGSALCGERWVTTNPLLRHAIPSPEASTTDPRALNVPEAF